VQETNASFFASLAAQGGGAQHGVFNRGTVPILNGRLFIFETLSFLNGRRLAPALRCRAGRSAPLPVAGFRWP